MKFEKAKEMADLVNRLTSQLNNAIAAAGEYGFQVKIKIESDSNWPLVITATVDPSKLEF